MDQIGDIYRSSRGLPGPWDAIVIGSGMGGLSAASLLAQDGLRVLLLEQNRIVGGCTQSYERGGYRWNIGMHYIGEVQAEHTTTWQLFDAVTGGGIEWNALPPIYNRMVIGDRTIEIPAGADAYAAALQRAFPGEAQAIERYLTLIRQVPRTAGPYFAQKALPSDVAENVYDDLCGPFHEYADRSTLDVLSELTTDPELIAVWCANWGDYSLPPSQSSFAMHCMLNKHYLNGASYPTGGGLAFARAIEPIVESAGGAIATSAEVDRILVREGRAIGVRLASGEEVTAPLVVSNAGVQNTFGRLLDPADADAQGLRKHLDEVGDSYALVGVNVGLSKSAAELDIDPANVWAHPSHDFDANLAAHAADFDAPFPFLFVTFPSVKDPTWEREFPGKSTVEMYGYTHFEHFEAWRGTSWRRRGAAYEARKRDIEGRLLSALFDLVPKARDCVDVTEVSTPLSYETFLKRERGGFMGVEASPERFRAQWLRAHTPIGGLYLSGQDVTTDGVIGALVGGVIAASAVLERDLLTEIRAQRSAA